MIDHRTNLYLHLDCHSELQKQQSLDSLLLQLGRPHLEETQIPAESRTIIYMVYMHLTKYM